MRLLLIASLLLASPAAAGSAIPLTSARCGAAWNTSSTVGQRATVMKTAPIGAFLNPGTIDEKVGSVIHKNPACFAMFVGANRTVIFQGEWVNTGVPVWHGPRINLKPFTLPVNSVVRHNGTVVVHTT